ncbi:methyltransferase domain-containing protein [Patescibacteria group bacterium]|nr:methyltransferase domain-containing protein [Patescibacteria group bacterium]
MIKNSNNKEYFLENQRFYDRLFEDEDHYGVKEYWHGWAGNFHRHRIKILRNLFVNILKCRKEAQILDIGSNVSMFGELFKPDDCPKITALEISITVIEKAKKISPHIKFIVGDAQAPELEGKWDILFAGEIIEHLSNPQEALSNWSNLLKQGGYLVISTPNRYFSRKTKEHISLLTIKETKEMLCKLDIKVVKMIGIDLFVPFFDRLFNAIAKHIPKSSLICDIIFQAKMKSTFKFPWLGRNIIYVARKS